MVVDYGLIHGVRAYYADFINPLFIINKTLNNTQFVYLLNASELKFRTLKRRRRLMGRLRLFMRSVYLFVYFFTCHKNYTTLFGLRSFCRYLSGPKLGNCRHGTHSSMRARPARTVPGAPIPRLRLAG